MNFYFLRMKHNMYMCLENINLNTNIYERKMLLIHDIPTSIQLLGIIELSLPHSSKFQ